MHCNRDYILTYDQHSLKFKALKDKFSVSSTIDISALPIGAVQEVFVLKSHIVLSTLSGPIWINSATNRAVCLPHQALKLEDGDELVAVFEHGNFLYQITSASITKVNLVSPESEPEIIKLDFVTQAVKTGDFVVLYESWQKRILITNLQTNEQTSVSLPAEARCIAAIVPS